MGGVVFEFTTLATTVRRYGLDYRHSYRVQQHDDDPELYRLELMPTVAGCGDSVEFDMHETCAARLASLLTAAPQDGHWTRVGGASARVSPHDGATQPLRLLEIELFTDEHGHQSVGVYLTVDEAYELALELDPAVVRA